MKKGKKLLSALLTLTIIMSQFVMMPISASAEVSGTDSSIYEEYGTPEIQFGSVNHFVNGTETASFVPSAGDVIASKITTFGAGKVTLIAALYNGDELRLATFDSQTVAETSVLETSLTVPDMDEEWEYKCFVWDGIETLYPFTPSNEELVLKASGTINTVSLVWDSADGNMEAVDIYRDGVKIETIGDGIGGYIDQVEPGTYTYYIKNASGRTSDIVTATSLDVFDHIEALGGAYIQAGDVKANDITHGMESKADNSSISYMTGTDSSSQLPVGTYVSTNGTISDDTRTYNYYQGYKTTSDGGYTRVKGTWYPESLCTPQADPFTEVPEATTTIADGVSYVFYQPGSVYRSRNTSKTDSTTGAITYTYSVNTSSANRMNFKITDGWFEDDVTDYSIFVEYWGTRTKAISVNYPSSAAVGASSATALNSVNMTLDSTASSEWKTARLDVTDAAFGTSNSKVIDSNIKAPNIIFNKNGAQMIIRRIAIVPSEALNTYYTSSGTITSIANVTQQAGQFGPSGDCFRTRDIVANEVGAVVDFTQLTEAPEAGWYGSDGISISTQYGSGDGYTEIVPATDGADGYLKMYDNPYRVAADRGHAMPKTRWSFDDNYIYGMRDSNVQVEITYRSYNVASGTIFYSVATDGPADNNSFLSTEKRVNFNTDGELHTVVVDLENVNTMNRVFSETSSPRDLGFQAGYIDNDGDVDGVVNGENCYLAVYKVVVRRADSRLMQDLSN